jgi:hypothetical protein
VKAEALIDGLRLAPAEVFDDHEEHRSARHGGLGEQGCRKLTPELVGMKRLDLHGDVGASSPHRF